MSSIVDVKRSGAEEAELFAGWTSEFAIPAMMEERSKLDDSRKE
jgi:hypothetical protein